MSQSSPYATAILAALTWRKSSLCGPDSNNCIEVAVAGSHVLVRDSKSLPGRPLGFGHDQWAVFVRGL